MKTDPREACSTPNEDLWWALVHDGLAHPLMALTNYAGFAVRFHNWTSRKAWPKKPLPGALYCAWDTARHGIVRCFEASSTDPCLFRVEHGVHDRVVVLQAPTCFLALEKGIAVFDWLDAT
jgi:hypothetical protein